MIVLELNQVEVDHCLACGGVWLDGEEMDLLLEGSAARAEIRAQLEPEPGSGEHPIKCPICLHKMEKARVRRAAGERSILIDRCGHNHGSWLDGGELHAIVEMSGFPEAHRIHEFLRAVFRGSTRPATPGLS